MKKRKGFLVTVGLEINIRTVFVAIILIIRTPKERLLMNNSANDLKPGSTEIWVLPGATVNNTMTMLTLSIFEGGRAQACIKKWLPDLDGGVTLHTEHKVLNNALDVISFFGSDWLALNLYELSDTDYSHIDIDDIGITPIGPMVSSVEGVCSSTGRKILSFLNKVHDTWGDKADDKGFVGVQTVYYEECSIINKRRVINILRENEDVEHFYQENSNGYKLHADAVFSN